MSTSELPVDSPDNQAEENEEQTPPSASDNVAEPVLEEMLPKETASNKPASKEPVMKQNSPTEADRRSTLSNFPLSDSQVMAELKAADQSAQNTVKLIQALRSDIAKYQQKDDMTDDDIKTLQGLHDDLMAKLSEFEDISRNVQRLLGLTDKPSSQLGSLLNDYPEQAGDDQQPSKRFSRADSISQNKKILHDLQENLPRVVVCGRRHEDDVPKIIVCDGQPKKDEFSIPTREVPEKDGSKPKKDDYLSQNQKYLEGGSSRPGLDPKLAQCNLWDLCNLLKEASFNCPSGQPQSSGTMEALQAQINELQHKMLQMSKENAKLQKKLLATQTRGPVICKKKLCQKISGAISESDTCSVPNANGDVTPDKQLEKQIEVMECVVANIKNEVTNVQTQRKNLKSQQQLLQCAFAHQPPRQKELALQHQKVGFETNPCTQQLENQLRDLNEQYCRLDCELKEKVKETSHLRTELQARDKIIEQINERCYLAEARVEDLVDRLNMVDADRRQEMADQAKYLDMKHQSEMAIQNWKEVQQELEALQIFVEDRDTEIESYRNKYLKAQQDMEEQKRYVEKLNIQSREIKEQLLTELQQYKSQIQEKIAELLPLPEKLRNAELKMTLYQENIEELTRELNEARDIIAYQNNSSNITKEERDALLEELTKKEAKLQELQNENLEYKAVLLRFEELTQQNEWLYEEKVHEVTQLSAQLTTLREESARICANLKESNENSKQRFLERISALEKELASTRAVASAASKERDASITSTT
ncbi:paramyosin isoform X2 [Nilaparvata lugens]|uniref:paramyosin isoform X2 n=1 Tax=Nilaparvata lugens TaxID=108931 RepID=UPI00193D3947|nr:paramyosin isoform X2 [Nilaparvata lugens]